MKVFEISVIKTVQSFHITLSQGMQTSFRFPNRRMEDSKTNISRHICVITDVKAVCN